jgi:hypothetical protein
MLHVMPPMLISTLVFVVVVTLLDVEFVVGVAAGAAGEARGSVPAATVPYTLGFFFPAQQDFTAAPSGSVVLPKLSRISSAWQRQSVSVQRQSTPQVHDGPQKRQHDPWSSDDDVVDAGVADIGAGTGFEAAAAAYVLDFNGEGGIL